MSTDPQPEKTETYEAFYLKLTVLIQVLILIGLVFFVLRRDWTNVFLTVIVMGLTMLPAIARKRYHLVLPPEFQLISAAFVFLSLFLGSATDFYYKYPWWDVVLHTGSGFLLGIIGFLTVFILNQSRQIPEGIKPRFLCLFAICFAVTLGVVWEIFEFAVDCIAPEINMQSREEGVYDTMYDLIVDTLGAVIVTLMGWAYLKSGRYAFIADGIRKFIAKNPELFESHAAEKK